MRERTREITSILRYTPAVVYIKDREGRYTLVNYRYEELFGIRREQIYGKSDYDIFPRPMADETLSDGFGPGVPPGDTLLRDYVESGVRYLVDTGRAVGAPTVLIG